MSNASNREPWAPLEKATGDALFAQAVLVLKGRLELPTINATVEYLYSVADDIGVDSIDLAGLIVEACERRAAAGDA